MCGRGLRTLAVFAFCWFSDLNGDCGVMRLMSYSKLDLAITKIMNLRKQDGGLDFSGKSGGPPHSITGSFSWLCSCFLDSGVKLYCLWLYLRF